MVLVDLNNEDSDLAELEKGLTEAVHARAETLQGDTKDETGKNATQDAQESHDPDLPDKLKGKSLEDIAAMYKNLESAYGRMANDLGQQRKLTDRLLELKRSEDLEQNGGTKQPAPEKVEFTGSQLLDDPMQVLDKYLEAKLGRYQSDSISKVEQLEKSLAERDFIAKHGDISQLGQDPKFAEYVNASPYRVQRAQQAAAGDWVAADELLTDYKALFGGQQKDARTEESHDAKPEKTSEANSALKEAQKAQLESAGNGQSASNKKHYSRAALMQLRLTNPDKYYDPAFQDEILQAYQEKRVK